LANLASREEKPGHVHDHVLVNVDVDVVVHVLVVGCFAVVRESGVSQRVRKMGAWHGSMA